LRNSRPFANSKYAIQDADFRRCTQILKPINAIAFGENKADYFRRLCCIAASAGRRTGNILSACPVKYIGDMQKSEFNRGENL